jgi:hypothetical protein
VRRWSPAEDAVLVAHYRREPAARIGERIGRSALAVRKRADSLGLHGLVALTREEAGLVYRAALTARHCVASGEHGQPYLRNADLPLLVELIARLGEAS